MSLTFSVLLVSQVFMSLNVLFLDFIRDRLLETCVILSSTALLQILQLNDMFVF